MPSRPRKTASVERLRRLATSATFSDIKPAHRPQESPVSASNTLHLWEKRARKTRNATSGGGGRRVFKQIRAFPAKNLHTNKAPAPLSNYPLQRAQDAERGGFF